MYAIVSGKSVFPASDCPSWLCQRSSFASWVNCTEFCEPFWRPSLEPNPPNTSTNFGSTQCPILIPLLLKNTWNSFCFLNRPLIFPFPRFPHRETGYQGLKGCNAWMKFSCHQTQYLGVSTPGSWAERWLWASGTSFSFRLHRPKTEMASRANCVRATNTDRVQHIISFPVVIWQLLFMKLRQISLRYQFIFYFLRQER